MFEKTSVNKFNKNNLLIKKIEASKKLIEILRPVAGRSLGSPTLYIIVARLLCIVAYILFRQIKFLFH